MELLLLWALFLFALSQLLLFIWDNYLRHTLAQLWPWILSTQSILAKQVKLSDLSKDGLSLFKFMQIGDEFIYLLWIFIVFFLFLWIAKSGTRQRKCLRISHRHWGFFNVYGINKQHNVQMIVIIMVLSGIYEGSICLTMCAASNVTVLPRFTLGSVTGTFILQNVICIHIHV